MQHKNLLQKLCLTTIIATIFTGCFKDSGTKTYKLYTPVYQTAANVRAAIKSDAPTPITSIGKMVILGNYIYLNELEKGIHIIDNTNPANPVNKGFINIPGNENLAIKDNILYADCYIDLLAIDISNPDNIILKSAVDNLFPERRYINGYQTYYNTIITDWLVKDTTVDISIEEGQGIWTKGGSYLTPYPIYFMGGSFAAVADGRSGIGTTGSTSKYAILENYLYALSSNKINTVNISQPEAPKLASSTINNGSIETIFPFKDKLFIGAQTGMFVYSVANPNNPTQLSQFTHARRCDPVITDGKFAYVTLRSGSNICTGTDNELNVVDIANLSQTVLVKTYPLTHPNGLSKDGNLLFICDGEAGLKVFDATNANNVQLKQTLKSTDTYDVIAFNNIAYVTAKDGLYQYNYSNPNSVTLLSKIGINK